MSLKANNNDADIESSSGSLVVETAVVAGDVLEEPHAATARNSSSSSAAWKWLLAASLACFVASRALAASSETIQTLVVRSPAASSSSLALAKTESSAPTAVNAGWHIKPIHPYHNGRVVYLSENTAQGTIYTREFTVPCHYGMLVFNVGPAASYEPYSYDVYEDAYAYSDNKGLCFLYPSWKGTQTSTRPMWTSNDPTDQKVGLGDTPTKISTRVVKLPGTKDMDAKRGGDFVIMRSGNFYNPGYYKHLKSEINRWPGGMDAAAMEEAVREWVAKMETGVEFAALAAAEEE